MPQSSASWWFIYLSKEGVWITEIIIGVALLVLANFGINRLIFFLKTRTWFNSLYWKDKLHDIFYQPLHVLLWIFGGVYVIDVLSRRFGFSIALDYIDPIRNGAIICCLAWLLMRWKTTMQHVILTKSRHEGKAIDPATVHVIGKLSTIAIVVVTAMVILQIVGLNILPLVAFGGIGAAALGFAGKDVIANFFGGLMLYITRPFTVGDLILLPDRNLEGTVEEIGWYITSVRDKEKRPVYLPNSIFPTVLVINSSRMSHRRIEERIGISYNDFPKVKDIVANIKKEISSHPSIDTHLPILVFFNAFNDYSLDIYIDVYSLATRFDEFLAVKEEILLKIYDVIRSHGAEMPYPTTMLAYPADFNKP